MTIGSNHTKLIAAVVALLAVSAVAARAAEARPDTWKLHYQTRAAAQLQVQNKLGSQLDRIVQPSDAFERALVATEEENSRALRAVYSDLVQPPPDAFERAVAVRQAEIASRSANGTRHQPPTAQPSITGDGGGSFDWGLVGALSAVFAVCFALGGGAVVLSWQRGRSAHP